LDQAALRLLEGGHLAAGRGLALRLPAARLRRVLVHHHLLAVQAVPDVDIIALHLARPARAVRLGVHGELLPWLHAAAGRDRQQAGQAEPAKDPVHGFASLAIRRSTWPTSSATVLSWPLLIRSGSTRTLWRISSSTWISTQSRLASPKDDSSASGWMRPAS